MDTVEILFIVALAIMFGWALALALSRGRVIERLEEVTGGTGADDVERHVRLALEETEDARWNAEQTSHDTGYLTELLTAGVVRLDRRRPTDGTYRGNPLWQGDFKSTR